MRNGKIPAGTSSERDDLLLEPLDELCSSDDIFRTSYVVRRTSYVVRPKALATLRQADVDGHIALTDGALVAPGWRDVVFGR